MSLQRLLTLTPVDAGLRTLHFTVEPPQLMRAAGCPWDHEIRVALPVSYPTSDRAYPVLWVTDNLLEAALSVLGHAQAIVVSVGYAGVSVREDNLRRPHDFIVSTDVLLEGPAGEYLRREYASLIPEWAEPNSAGDAQRFLDFLVDDVRAAIAAQYRVDLSNQGLFGHSFGGAFVVYALFARPGAFTRYICASPTLYIGNGILFDLEAQYAATHDDLPVHVFFGAGQEEATEYLHAAQGCLSSMIRMAEIMSLRAYPSLELECHVFPGEAHSTIVQPALRWGVRSVWGEELY